MATSTTSKTRLKSSAAFDFHARSLPAPLLIFLMVSGFVFFWLNQQSSWGKKPKKVPFTVFSKKEDISSIVPTVETNSFSEVTWQEYSYYLELGKEFKKQKNYRSALESLQKAKDTLDSPEIRQMLSELLFLEQVTFAENALQKGVVEEAISHWKKALSFQDSESLREQLFKAELKLQTQILEQQNQAVLQSLLTQARQAVQKGEWKNASKGYAQAKNLGGLDEKTLEEIQLFQQKIEQLAKEQQFQEYFERANLLLEEDLWKGLAYLKRVQKEFPVYKSECLSLRKKNIQKHLDQLLIEVPSGVYRIGSEGSEDEQPIHNITLAVFQMDRIPVTHWQYALFLEDSHLTPPSYWLQGKYPVGEENFPVVEVNFEEASLFAHWANKRIPTEFEWEAAARTLKNWTFPWGNEALKDRSNHRDAGFARVCAVEQFPANANGFFDFVGNVSQWTDSVYNIYPGGTHLSAYGKAYRTIRGGSFLLALEHLRIANRSYESPLVRLPSLGFRCARSGLRKNK